MANSINQEVEAKFEVSPLLPEKFNFGQLDFVAANLTVEQAQKLADNPKFTYINPKAEAPKKAKKQKAEAAD